MNVKKIFLDLDDTILDTFRYLIKWHNQPYPYDSLESLDIYDKTCHYRKQPGESSTRESLSLLGLSYEKCWKSLPTVFWTTIPMFPWANMYIEHCEHLAGKENVYILTKHIPTKDCSGGKVEWVNQNLPEYIDRLIVCRKKHAVVDGHSLLIDDCEKNEEDFNRCGKSKNFYLFPSFLNKRRDMFFDIAGYTRSDPYKGHSSVKARAHNNILTEINKKFLEL